MLTRILRKIDFMVLESRIKKVEEFLESSHLEQLTPQIAEENKAKLKPYYDQYVREVSVPEMAASLELASFLYSICSVGRYSKVLDLGSGFSSFVLRLYASENPGVTVFTVDDDAAWMEKSRNFLEQHKLNTQNISLLDSFLQSGETDFDCILHDLNFVEVRIHYVGAVLKRIKPGGVLILDDAHKPDYRYALLVELNRDKFKACDVKSWTCDVFGRYALAVVSNRK